MFENTLATTVHLVPLSKLDSCKSTNDCTDCLPLRQRAVLWSEVLREIHPSGGHFPFPEMFEDSLQSLRALVQLVNWLSDHVPDSDLYYKTCGLQRHEFKCKDYIVSYVRDLFVISEDQFLQLERAQRFAPNNTTPNKPPLPLLLGIQFWVTFFHWKHVIEILTFCLSLPAFLKDFPCITTAMLLSVEEDEQHGDTFEDAMVDGALRACLN